MEEKKNNPDIIIAPGDAGIGKTAVVEAALENIERLERKKPLKILVAGGAYGFTSAVSTLFAEKGIDVEVSHAPEAVKEEGVRGIRNIEIPVMHIEPVDYFWEDKVNNRATRRKAERKKKK